MEFYPDKFRELREKKFIPIKLIASELRISRNTVYNWEIGKTQPSEEAIRKLAEVISVPVSLFSNLKELNKNTQSASEMRNLFTQDGMDSCYSSVINGVMDLQKKAEQTNALLKAVMASGNVLFYIKDVNLRYVIVNEQFLANLNFKLDYITLGKMDGDFFNADEANANTAEDELVLSTGRPVSNNERFLIGSKKKKYCICSQFPVYDPNNKVIGLAGIFIDITKRIQSEGRRQLLELAVKNLNTGFAIYEFKDNKNRIIFSNKYFEDITLFPPVLNRIETEYHKYVDIIDKDIEEKFVEFLNLEIYPKSIEVPLTLKKYNREYYFHISVEKYNNFYIVIINDVTEKRNSILFDELFNLFFIKENTGFRIWEYESGTHVYANDTICQIYECSKEEMLSERLDSETFLNDFNKESHDGLLTFMKNPLFYASQNKNYKLSLNINKKTKFVCGKLSHIKLREKNYIFVQETLINENDYKKLDY